MTTSAKPLAPSFVPFRESAEHRVEILHLEDAAARKGVPVEEAVFIVDGGRLHDGDAVKVARKQKH